MPDSKNKQLADVSLETVLEKSRLGIPLNLKELAVRTGRGYGYWREMKKEGLPLSKGRITYRAAVQWVKAHEERQPRPMTTALRAARAYAGYSNDRQTWARLKRDRKLIDHINTHGLKPPKDLPWWSWRNRVSAILDRIAVGEAILAK